MFNFLLNISEKLAIGGEVTLRGMGTVFAVLILIWFLVELLHLLLGEKSKPVKKAPEVATAPEPIKTVAAEQPAPVSAETAQADDYTLIAVITAAIAASSGASPNSFRVVSFKRANNNFANGKQS